MKIEKIANPLVLTSENELVLHFIGTGSAFAKKNYQNNLIIIKNDTHIVVDFGTIASQGLLKKGLNSFDIKAFLITHQHADHIGGLEEVALMSRYFTKKKPDLIVPEFFAKQLWNESLKGGIAHNEKPELTLNDIFNVIYPSLNEKYPRPVYEINYKGIDLKIFKTLHIPGNVDFLKDASWSSGVLIDERILFTADTKFDPDLLYMFDDLFDIELIIHDCQLFTGGVHAGYDELKTLPHKLKSKMLLSHYGDNWEQFSPEKDGFLGFADPQVYYKFPLKQNKK